MFLIKTCTEAKLRVGKKVCFYNRLFGSGIKKEKTKATMPMIQRIFKAEATP